jgi:molecular chaperone IbpA
LSLRKEDGYGDARFHAAVPVVSRLRPAPGPALRRHRTYREHLSPYNIEKCGEDQYRIVIALAGFGKDDVEMLVEQNRLLVRGHEPESDGRTYLHRGIATRSFERHFDLADYVEVTNATMGEGLLVVDLKREIPEALKPRRVPISAGVSVSPELKGNRQRSPETLGHKAA